MENSKRETFIRIGKQPLVLDYVIRELFVKLIDDLKGSFFYVFED